MAKNERVSETKQIRVRAATWLKLWQIQMRAVNKGEGKPTMDEIIERALKVAGLVSKEVKKQLSPEAWK